jgi:hypothetical protein
MKKIFLSILLLLSFASFGQEVVPIEIVEIDSLSSGTMHKAYQVVINTESVEDCKEEFLKFIEEKGFSKEDLKEQLGLDLDDEETNKLCLPENSENYVLTIDSEFYFIKHNINIKEDKKKVQVNQKLIIQGLFANKEQNGVTTNNRYWMGEHYLEAISKDLKITSDIKLEKFKNKEEDVVTLDEFRKFYQAGAGYTRKNLHGFSTIILKHHPNTIKFRGDMLFGIGWTPFNKDFNESKKSFLRLSVGAGPEIKWDTENEKYINRFVVSEKVIGQVKFKEYLTFMSSVWFIHSTKGFSPQESPVLDVTSKVDIKLTSNLNANVAHDWDVYWGPDATNTSNVFKLGLTYQIDKDSFKNIKKLFNKKRGKQVEVNN